MHLHSFVSIVRRLRVAAAALALAAAPLAAQTAATVTGKVTDKQTGEPIAGARVSVEGTLAGASTRQNGTFSLVVPAGKTALRATAIGYAAGRATVSGSATIDFALERSAINLEEISTTGSRAPERSTTSSPVPVDVITPEMLQSTGRVELAQALQMLAPSVNFPRPSVADGTDHTRPVTLRGLAPDQVLVLVNGKRRHTSALINVNGTVGRGSGMVDLNALPATAIERIEILRDGAAAQYGSDAIAGVVNIVLKKNQPNEVLAQFGQTGESDGRTVTAAVNYAVPGLTKGYLNVNGEFRSRGFTNRSAPDRRQQFFTGDPRNADPALQNPRYFRYGDADTKDGALFVNFGRELSPRAELYVFGGGSYREGEAAANYRLPRVAGSVPAIFPIGFLPLIGTDIWDMSGGAGIRGTMGDGWKYDVSSVLGGNSFRFGLRNTVNASLGAQSPTTFDAGQLIFNQLTNNIDISKQFDVGAASPLNVAFGAEARFDRYQIKQGDQPSYVQGTVTQRANLGPNGSTAVAPAGAQGFPGFRPTDEVTENRNAVAGYLDLELSPVKQLLVGAAARFERYNDFGNQATWKLTARVEPVEGFALRGAVATGFRAPSLGQNWFSATATNLIGGQLLDVRTFPVRSPEAQALGAQPLRPETSTNLSAGLVVNPTKNVQVTADFYQIDIDDRIVLSGNYTQTAVATFLASRGFSGVAGGRFFTNAISTRTRGVDLVVNYGVTLSPTATLRLTGAANIGLLTGRQQSRTGTDSIEVRTATLVRSISPAPQALINLVGASDATLFDRVERGRIEFGQPKDNFSLLASLDVKDFTFNLRGQRFGEVTVFQNIAVSNCPAGQPQVASCIDQTLSAKVITDVSASYRIAQRYQLTVGVDNLFDVYPDRSAFDGPVATAPLTGFGGNSNFGIFPYSGAAPFGFNGRFLYGRVNVGF
ncbi:MAG: TonB-dependent receptor [Gemmatimonadales bacterium]|nr:TonB-dependent receptor [Gemmatimonadales bacterium]